MKNELPATAELAIKDCSLSRLTASSSNFRPGLMTVQTASSLKKQMRLPAWIGEAEYQSSSPVAGSYA
jgi:hypothetical protein